MKFKSICERNPGYVHLYCLKCGGAVHTEIGFALCVNCEQFYKVILKPLKSWSLKA
ncbi:hypothetical protein AAA799E16_01758 [Marine Group I thaumarchaeote SCGC AAA799-E16]|uniref:Uncharacterized protein n=5 Tax=Marine Group I TaxID=905826 RepID=A0A087S8J4_9ARCH|nr:hypothetical protein AAA799N04_00409 [Marine Group I thaumarchaeote SCGC AAA799-N04]KER05586.1 hypothetical protein AAA799E16_01758 [Marine Group I thaumarchaeote SCGC AAA799-E16]KFM18202.1 hypothetical protein SCCGRSA3_01272 [Marine Group I thaumarchaeote SCGC RSA3]KFM20021.1 hypothetical protein AAA799P11_00326 [Marine Group I thaumarchaeote SCGC AAA799-P11]KFM22048.1 hypothetical protein AAA799B03_00386 [Marine Group I thaumarchaeote SCGC AAA799-B03]